ncbi:MAG: alpha-amylase family glycosyl hydrolase, partial [Candidatus Neomarinimicrobiota bacterium]
MKSQPDITARKSPPAFIAAVLLTLAILITKGSGQAVTWEPALPWQGGTVTIYYNAVARGIIPDANPVYIHLGYNGWSNVPDPANDPAMTSTGTPGLWFYDYAIPQDAEVIDFCFQDKISGWDNNGGYGVDWHIKVAPAGFWLPIVPTPNDTITIIADTTGDLWWGVNGWQEPIPEYWPEDTHIGDPGASVESPLSGPDTTGHYYIKIGPFQRGEQPVEVVDFVFHWSDGTWDNNNEADYHILLDLEPQAGDPLITNLSHQDNDVVNGDELLIFTTSGSDSTEIWIDGSLVYSNAGDSHTYYWQTDTLTFGQHTIWIRAEGANGRVTFQKVTVWKAPDIVMEPLPAGAELGVTDHGNGTVTFALLAPAKAFVCLLGSWADWDPDSLVMNYDIGQSIWWLTELLTPGTYQYMYLINGQKQLGDPYATDVEWKLPNGQEDWQYVENQICQFKVGAEPFVWTDDGWIKPVMEDLVIYELLVRDFSSQRNFAGVIEKLDYLADLGINAIELLPNYEFPGESSWGYNPAFYFAVESAYGTPEDFKTLVNEAHARGIAVIMDLVFNHCDGRSPFYQLYEQNYDDSPYVHAEQNPWGMPDFDHTKEGTKRLVKDVVRYWIEEYHVDGYRYDNTTGFGWDGAMDRGIALFSYEAWLADSNTYQIAEHFAKIDEIKNMIRDSKINSHWHDIFHDQMKANLREGPFEGRNYGYLSYTADGIDFQEEGFRQPRNIVNYTESHDEQRVIWEAQTNPAIDYQLAVQKSKLGAAILLTATGVPMLYHGQEFGMDTEKTLDYNPLIWSKLETETGRELHSYYRKLLQLRQQTPALRGTNCDFTYD